MTVQHVEANLEKGTVEPNTVVLSMRRKDSVRWTTMGGDAVVLFPSDPTPVSLPDGAAFDDDTPAHGIPIVPGIHPYFIRGWIALGDMPKEVALAAVIIIDP